MTELELKIKQYANAYYSGIAEISDEEFDALVDELRRTNPDSEILNSVGWGMDYEPTYGAKVEHKYQVIGSLDKVKEVEDIPDYAFPVLSAKLDGLSAVLYYNHGVLNKAVTRYKGTYGIDITNKILKVKNCTVLKDPFTGSIRGELVISNTNWELLKKSKPKYENPRNAVAGLINSKTVSDALKYVSFVTYNILGYENLTTDINQGSVYKFLVDNGFDVAPHEYENPPYKFTNEKLKALYDKWNSIYPCDGLVIGDMNLTRNNNNAIMYNQISYKFQAESKTTTVIGIEWSLTRTGKIMPVVLVEPTKLSGATVRRCTGNNAKFIQDNKITAGTKVIITRSNEVIPKILSVLPNS